MDALERTLLNARVVETAVERAITMLCQPDDDGRALRHELQRLEREIRHYTAAVAAGGDVPFLVAQLRATDDRRREIAARLRVVETTVAGLNPRTVLADLRTMLADWRSLMFGEPVQARGIVRQLIVGKLELAPDADRRGFTFSGTGTLEPFLRRVIPGFSADVPVPQNGTSPMPASWNQIVAWLKQIDAVRQAA